MRGIAITAQENRTIVIPPSSEPTVITVREVSRTGRGPEVKIVFEGDGGKPVVKPKGGSDACSNSKES